MPDVTIIVSSPRSGSSWLSRALRQTLGKNVYTHNTLSNQFLYLLFPGSSLNPLVDDQIPISKGWGIINIGNRIRVNIIKKYYRANIVDLPVVLISATMVNYLSLLSEAFPQAKYIHLKRDPLDTVASLNNFLKSKQQLKFVNIFKENYHRGFKPAFLTAGAHLFHKFRWCRFTYGGYVGIRPGGFQNAVKLPWIEFLCWYYNSIEEQILMFLENIPAERKLDFNYEDLVGNYNTVFGRMLKFVGSESLLESIPQPHDGIKTTAINRAEKTFSSEEIDIATRFLENEIFL